MSSLSTSGPSPYLLGSGFPSYGTQYNTALDLNNQNYQNILGQYSQNLGSIQGQVSGVATGYGALSQQVQGTIQGIGASQAQQIADTYAQQSGALNQQLTQRGLGNTTVVGAMQRGVTLDSQKAQIALANQIAQLSAGYQSQLGSAGLNARLQGAGLQQQGNNQLLGTLGNYKTPYPNWPPGSSRSQSGGGGVSGGGGRGGMSGDGTSGDWWAGNPSIAGSYNNMMTPTNQGVMPQSYGGGTRLPQPMPQDQNYGAAGAMMTGAATDSYNTAAESPNYPPPEIAGPPEQASTQSGDINFDSESGNWGY